MWCRFSGLRIGRGGGLGWLRQVRWSGRGHGRADIEEKNGKTQDCKRPTRISEASRGNIAWRPLCLGGQGQQGEGDDAVETDMIVCPIGNVGAAVEGSGGASGAQLFHVGDQFIQLLHLAAVDRGQVEAVERAGEDPQEEGNEKGADRPVHR